MEKDKSILTIRDSWFCSVIVALNCLGRLGYLYCTDLHHNSELIVKESENVHEFGMSRMQSETSTMTDVT